MDSYISVQIIAKENTRFGVKVFRSCLQSLLDCDYANQIIVVNNDSAPIMVDMWQEMEAKFKAKGVETSYLQMPVVASSNTFSVLRNAALAQTSGDADFIHWIDTDEVYYPDKLIELREFLSRYPNLAVAIFDLYHFMIVPNMVQEIYPKDVLYRYTHKISWGKGVHEAIQNRSSGDRVEYHMPYLHFGYCRRQWRTALKWLHYDVIEKNNVGHYTNEWGGWTGTQTPDTIVADRLKVSKPFTLPYPQSLITEFGDHLQDDEAAWVKYLIELDPEVFWLRWLNKKNELGSWAATAEWAAKEAGAYKWAFV